MNATAQTHKAFTEEDIILSIQDALNEVPDESVIRFLSGEANCKIFNAVGKNIDEAIDKKGLKFRMIAGPILSVADDGKSELICLRDKYGDKEGFEMYFAPTRQLNHFRIFGDSLLWVEFPHERLSKERKGFDIRLSGDDKVAKSHIDRYIWYFDTTIKAKALKIVEDDDFIFLTNEEVGELKKRSPDREFILNDSMKKEEIINLLGGIEKIKFRSIDMLNKNSVA